MKKKSHHSAIPDFSTKKPGAPVAGETPNQKVKGFRPAPIPGGKPHSTSKKSGRRGV
ncbi:MAG TPA: hypothetical protein VM099_02045 [Gemmatimonadaceae bacterium]|nr:hypothetical protein [Gemmatimonadaceae bacterium]